MKFSILALGAAVAGISSQCAAQLNIESSFPTRGPETRLVSQQDIVGSSLSEATNFPSEDSTYFAPSPPQAEITRDQVGRAQSILNDIPSESAANESAAIQGRSVKKNIATSAPLEVLAMTPEVGMVPVCWQSAGGCPTPNPVAAYMAQTWCSNGLWDNYACQRARQCAHIQQQIYGHNRYTCGGCAACGSAGHHVARTAQSNCPSCGPSPSQCAQNIGSGSNPSANSPAQSLVVASPYPQSPLLGEHQVGLPVVEWNQAALGSLPPNYAQPAAQLTTAPATNRLPSGQPLLQLPENVPTVPQDAAFPAAPTFPSVIPSLPVPADHPVVASRPSASLR